MYTIVITYSLKNIMNNNRFLRLKIWCNKIVFSLENKKCIQGEKKIYEKIETNFFETKS